MEPKSKYRGRHLQECYDELEKLQNKPEALSLGEAFGNWVTALMLQTKASVAVQRDYIEAQNNYIDIQIESKRKYELWLQGLCPECGSPLIVDNESDIGKRFNNHGTRYVKCSKCNVRGCDDEETRNHMQEDISKPLEYV